MIAVKGLVHRLDGTPVLDGVSLTIDDGEFVVLAGANGAGKTTLVRHFNALLEPDAGTVRIDGTAASSDPVAARTAVGMVFQHPRDGFVAATVGADVAFGPENLGLSRPEIDRRVADALDAVGLADRHDARLDALSGGEQTRVAIAGALAMAPDHLVLDEPLAGLDARGRSALLDRLGSIADEGRSVVVVTHDLDRLVDLADRLVILAAGSIVADGPPNAVVEGLPAHGVDAPC